MTNYDWLISRLDAFIRKYYANRVIRGSLVFLSSLLLYILLVSVGEYFLYMPVWLRLMLVSLFIVSGTAALVGWVILPLSKMNKLGKLISHEQAAAIIGKHFPEVSDKLLNILQLKKQSGNIGSRELIDASVDQKSKQIAVIPITAAIDFSRNRKYLRFLLPVLLVGVFILVAAPNVFRDASERLLQPTRSFEKPAPFRFIITNDNLRAVRNNDFVLNVTVKGNALPGEVYIETANDKIPMRALENHSFQYSFKNVTDPVNFRLYAAGFYSQPYLLEVAQKPLLKAFKVSINYPSYTGRKDEVLSSLGDMTLPAGTIVYWAFVTEYTNTATIRFDNGIPMPLQSSANMYSYKFRFMNDTGYTFTIKNAKTSFADSFQYHVQVIQDQYPVLQVQEFKDTVSGKQVVLNGTAGDDYGISRVLFHYEITDEAGKLLKHQSVPLSVTTGALTNFQYYFDIETLRLVPGQRLNYYVEAWDNDGVHGSKATRSEVMSYRMYDNKQIDSAINANAQQINSGLSSSAQHTQQLQSQYKDMQSKMLKSDKLDWSQQQSLQEMMDKQLQLQSQLENVKKRFDEQKQQSEQKQYSDELKDKQNELDKQLDNLLNNELKDEIKKLQELMKKLNKDNAFQAMQQLEEQNKLFDMDLKRMQELMKKLEMDMRLEDMANKLSELSDKQTELRKQTQDTKTADNKALSKKQDDLKKQLDGLMQGDMKELQNLNSKMQRPVSLQDATDKGSKAGQEMKESENQLDNNDNQSSGQSQNKAAQNLQDMADALNKQGSGAGMEELKMNIRAVRQILTNLIRLSFDQEDLMGSVQHTSITSQKYLDNMQEQNRLHSNAGLIKDSLYVLGMRMEKLSATINKETLGLEYNMTSAIATLEDRNTGLAATQQQYAMMHANNLALMLNEILSHLLQMQAENDQGSKGSCNNPGGKKPGKGSKPSMSGQLQDIISKQGQLANSMQGKQQGNKGSNGSHGNQGSSSNEYGNSEELAKYAQQQAALRRQLQELSSLLNSNGMGNAKELQEIQKQMDKTETDLVNRHMDNELMLRQKEILSRLLEVQKAVREQEQDDKRQSNAPKEISRPVPPELQKYMQDTKQLLDAYRTVPPQLKPYYRNMVEQYYRMIGYK